MDLLNFSVLINFGFYVGLVLLAGFFIRALYRLVVWSKKMPKGALLMLAVFPVLSVFPIPPQEIKKLERIKQEQIQEEDENGDPLSPSTKKKSSLPNQSLQEGDDKELSQ